MFKLAEKTELNQISLTGMRAIVLVGLLIVRPRSLDEIRKAFIDLGIMEDENSDDILRIDLNTLKVMGCEISRASRKTGYKYILGKHPFTFKMKEDEAKILKKIYNRTKDSADISSLIGYDDLFRKIASHLDNEKAKEEILGISILKYYDVQMIKDLITDCAQHNTLDIIYKKPTSSNETRKEINAQKVVFQNDKVYLYGYDFDKKDSIVLNIKRIRSIESRRPQDEYTEPQYKKVKFLYKDLRKDILTENEQILENKENGYIVEGKYFTDFFATQRMLSLGAKCVVLEPVEFRNAVVNKIKEMRKIYE